jgi:hypothetical protein
MRLGVPFIAPRQLGAVENIPERQILPSVDWRTGHCPVQISFLIWRSRPLKSESRWRTGHAPSRCSHKAMCRQTKASGEKMPQTRPTRPRAREPPPPPGHAPLRCQNNQGAAYPKRGLRKSAKHQTPPYHPVAAPPPPHCSRYPRTMRRPTASLQQTRKKTTWLRTVGGGERSA